LALEMKSIKKLLVSELVNLAVVLSRREDFSCVGSEKKKRKRKQTLQQNNAFLFSIPPTSDQYQINTGWERGVKFKSRSLLKTKKTSKICSLERNFEAIH